MEQLCDAMHAKLMPLGDQAAVQRTRWGPADVGASQLGHFGVFRRQVGPAAWQRLLAPI